jgi:hypothetical protein
MEEQFLKSFLSLYGASIIKTSIVDGKIFGNLRFKDESYEEDSQEFSWIPIGDNTNLSKAISLCDFIKENHLNQGDKMLVSESELLTLLTNSNWSIDIAQNAIDFLFKIQVFMIDEGKETDYFFIHF